MPQDRLLSPVPGHLQLLVSTQTERWLPGPDSDQLSATIIQSSEEFKLISGE